MPASIGSVFIAIGGNVAGLNTAVGRSKAALRDLDQSVNRSRAAQRRFNRAAQALRRNLIGLGTVLGGSVAAGFVQSIRLADQLDRRLREVGTIAGSSAIDLGIIRDAVLDLSSATGQETGLLAEGYYQILSSGIREGADAFQVLEVSAKTAIAGLTDTATAAGTITAAINAFGLGAENAELVANQLLRTVDLARARFGELNAVISSAGPLANQLGIELHEIAAAFSVITLAGVPVSQAATQIRALLDAIIRQSPSARAEAERLGIEFSVQALEAMGLVGFLQQLTGTGVGSLRKMFTESEALRAGLVLTSEDGLREFARASEQVLEANGKLEDSFARISQNPGEQFRRSLNDLRTEATRLGAETLPAANFFVREFNDLIENLRTPGLPGRQLVTTDNLIPINELEELVARIDDISAGNLELIVESEEFDASITRLQNILRDRGGVFLPVGLPGNLQAIVDLFPEADAGIQRQFRLYRELRDLATERLAEENATAERLREQGRIAEETARRVADLGEELRDNIVRVFPPVDLLRDRGFESGEAFFEGVADSVRRGRARPAFDLLREALASGSPEDQLTVLPPIELAPLEQQQLERARILGQQATEDVRNLGVEAIAVGTIFSRFGQNVINDFDNIGNAVADLGKQLLELVLQLAVFQPLARSITSAIGLGPLPTAQSGGLRQGFTLVGEAGPEIVDFATPSRVYSNRQLSAALASGGDGTTVNINLDARGSDEASLERVLVRAIPVIEQGVQQSVEQARLQGRL